MSLSAQERANFTAAFSYIDQDSGGSISLSELLTCASDFGFDISLDELRSVVELVDTSGDGEIDIEEFLEIMTLMLYRHKLQSSSDDDDEDGSSGGGVGGGGAAAAASRKAGRPAAADMAGVSSFLGPDGSLSAAATPEEKARAQHVMKHRAAWAADAVQQLHTALQSIDACVEGIKAARDGIGIDADGGGGGSASIAAFQMRKAQEAAQAQLRISKASAARLVKRILVEAQARGITTAQLPQIESLELEEERESSGKAATSGSNNNNSGGDNNDNTSNNNNNDNNNDEAVEEESNSAVDPHALLKSLRALAGQLKAAAEALGANLVPVSMVKAHHTRGGGRALAIGAATTPSSRNARVAAKQEQIQQQQQQQQQPQQTTTTSAPKSSKPKINPDSLKSQLQALENYDLESTIVTDASSAAAAAAAPKRKPSYVSSATTTRPVAPATTANRGDGERKINEQVLSLVSGDASLPGSKAAQQVAAKASDQLRAVAQQVLRSWAFPITPVCEQFDLMDLRWAEYSSLLQGQEALTRPACPLGRACPDRYSHVHRLQLTHPCFCRVDRHPAGSPEAKELLMKQCDNPGIPLSEASLCPHMVRPVHGACYTHLPPLEEAALPSTYSAGGGGGMSSPDGGLSPVLPSLSPAPRRESLSILNRTSTTTATTNRNSPAAAAAAASGKLDPAAQRAARFNELRALVGRVDLSHVELGGIGAQAVAFVIAQDVAVQDNAQHTGQASQLYAVSSDEYASSSNHYRFKEVVLHKCCIAPAGAIALLRIAHNLRLLDLSNNSLGLKSIVIGKDAAGSESGGGGASNHPSTSRANINNTSKSVAASAEVSGVNNSKRPPRTPLNLAEKKQSAVVVIDGGDEADLAPSGGSAAAVAREESSAAMTASVKKEESGAGAAAAALLLQQQQALKEAAEAAAATPSLMGMHLRELLYRNGNLTHLNLSGNKLSDSDGVGIAEGLKSNSTLRVLDVSSNELGPRFGRDFAATMLDNMDLRCIRLGYNPLEQSGTAAICEVIKESSVLEEVDLTWTGLGPQAAIFLADMVSNNQSLAKLVIPNNAIQLNGAIAIARALPNSQSLIVLDIGNNVLNELGVVEVLNGLRNNSSLCVLDITNTAQNAATIMKEIGMVTADRLQKYPKAPNASVIFGEQLAQQVPAHLQVPDAELKLQKVPAAAKSGLSSSSGAKKAATAAGGGIAAPTTAARKPPTAPAPGGKTTKR